MAAARDGGAAIPAANHPAPPRSRVSTDRRRRGPSGSVRRRDGFRGRRRLMRRRSGSGGSAGRWHGERHRCLRARSKSTRRGPAATSGTKPPAASEVPARPPGVRGCRSRGLGGRLFELRCTWERRRRAGAREGPPEQGRLRRAMRRRTDLRESRRRTRSAGELRRRTARPTAPAGTRSRAGHRRFGCAARRAPARRAARSWCRREFHPTTWRARMRRWRRAPGGGGLGSARRSLGRWRSRVPTRSGGGVHDGDRRSSAPPRGRAA